jgi:hypothetical protein
MLESERVFSAVWNRLRGDATLLALLGAGERVHRDFAPQGTATPYLTVSLTSAVDALPAIGTTRLWQDTLVMVKVVGSGIQSRLLIRDIADRVDTLLDGHAVTVSGVVVNKLRRESAPPQPPDVVGGVVYPMLNQQYRSEAYQAA